MPSRADSGAVLMGGRTTRLARGAVRLKPPRGFTGRARVAPAETGERAFGAFGAAMPPGLAEAGHLFQPLALPGTRGLAHEPVAIELDALAGSSRQVTPDTPLTIVLDIPGERGLTEAPQGLLAVVSDGEAYYPVGRSTTTDHIDIEWLPDMPDTDATGARSLGQSAKLLIYQVMGWREPVPGLYRAQVVPTGADGAPLIVGEHVQFHAGGETRYRRVTSGELQPGQKVALIVHGFGSSTAEMVAELEAVFKANEVQYDHVLTFDYPTIRAGVRGPGTQLADALRELGFSPQDGLTLDVFAHSLGALVTRYMIEIAGGRRFVDRVFLAGPPNQGTQLASLKGGLLWLITLGLNLGGAALPGMAVTIAGWALKIVDQLTISLDDIVPGSTIVHDLRNTARTGEVRYYVLAGSNEVAPPTSGGWAWLARQVMRGADATLDAFFQDQNDLLVNVNSMTGLDRVYPGDLWQAQVVPCHHFDYFTHAEATQQLAVWLTSEPTGGG